MDEVVLLLRTLSHLLQASEKEVNTGEEGKEVARLASSQWRRRSCGEPKQTTTALNRRSLRRHRLTQTGASLIAILALFLLSLSMQCPGPV